MRALLCLLLCLLVLVLGLATAVVQCRNHARGRALAEMQRRCEMVEAAAVQMKARASAHIPGEHLLAQEPAADGAELSDGTPVEGLEGVQ